MELLNKPPLMIITGSSGESLVGIDRKSSNNLDAITGWAPVKRNNNNFHHHNVKLIKPTTKLPVTRNSPDSKLKPTIRINTPQSQALKMKILPISIPIFSPFTQEPRFRGFESKKAKVLRKGDQSNGHNSKTPKLVELVSQARERILLPDFSNIQFPEKARDQRRPITSSLPRELRSRQSQQFNTPKLTTSTHFKPHINNSEADIKPTSSEVVHKFPVEPFEPKIKPKHDYKRYRTKSINLKLNQSTTQDISTANDTRNGNNSTIDADSKQSARNLDYENNAMRPYSVRNAKRFFDPENFAMMFFKKNKMKKSIDLGESRDSSRSPSQSQSPVKIEIKPNSRYLNEPSERIKSYLRKLSVTGEIPSIGDCKSNGSSLPSPRMMIKAGVRKSHDGVQNLRNSFYLESHQDNFSPHCEERPFNNSAILEISKTKIHEVRTSKDWADFSKARSPRIGPWEGSIVQ